MNVDGARAVRIEHALRDEFEAVLLRFGLVDEPGAELVRRYVSALRQEASARRREARALREVVVEAEAVNGFR